ncbi:hypothetical protein BN903_52 [Halorubrum sp. AJ67]|nr:hypothetical protein BN903_52 [Halorubrum sp. AJ67]
MDLGIEPRRDVDRDGDGSLDAVGAVGRDHDGVEHGRSLAGGVGKTRRSVRSESETFGNGSSAI